MPPRPTPDKTAKPLASADIDPDAAKLGEATDTPRYGTEVPLDETGVLTQVDGPPAALLGDGAQRDESDEVEAESSDDDPYGSVQVVSTGPTVVVHGQTLAAGQDAITVANDAETQEQVAAGLIAVVE